MEISLIDPKEFKVARVISFREEFTGLSGTICYMRPYTKDYNKETLDDFDNSMIEWLKSLNLKDVEFIHSEDILFDYQKPQLSKIYNGGRPCNKLLLVCHGDYSLEEIVAKREIEAIQFELNVFWNTYTTGTLPSFGGTMTFDKNKEKYYFKVIKDLNEL